MEGKAVSIKTIAGEFYYYGDFKARQLETWQQKDSEQPLPVATKCHK
jgi:hypothetical protein